MSLPARLLAACLLLAAPAFAAPPTTASPKPGGSSGLDLTGIDRKAKPGDDFFRYANGAWYDRTEIPPDRGGVGVFADLAELTSKRTADLIQNAEADKSPASRKVADYYSTYLDEAAIEGKGLKPLQPTLDRIAAIQDRKALSTYLGSTLRTDVDAFNATNFYTPNLFGLWIAADIDQPTRYLPFLMQGGLDMPDRSYYLDASPRMEELRAKQRTHVVATLKLAGVADADARAAKVIDLEKKIAQLHASREETEDARNGKNHWTRAQFDTAAPGLDWPAYFGAAGLGSQPEFVAWQPKAITGLAALVGSEPLEVWRDYLVFHAVDAHAFVLPKAFVDERFAFHGQALSGTPQQRPRWKRAVDATNAAVGETVGQLYVARYFPPQSKAAVETMVKNIIAAFDHRVDDLAWMTPETKAKAKAKLAVLKIGVGYPDQWTDYSGLEIVKGDAFGNAERADLFETRMKIGWLGKAVNRDEWVMTPQTVNAVNLPALNAMNFPAAILQPPFFDPSRPALMNYGAIGSTIGHEISHSFDDQGALFDATGRMENWWTPADKEHFEDAAARLAKQYDAYKPFPDLAVNGKLTLGENIADVAGLAATYDAYHASLGGKTPALVDGLTGDQQFFVSFGQTWRSKMREQLLRQIVLTNGHAPGEYRADTVRNLDAWYAAFSVKPGDKLYLAPADRVKMW